VDNLYLPTDFVVLDMDEDLQPPIILGRPFMATTRTLIDVEAGTLTLWVQDQFVVFNLFETAKRSAEQQERMLIDMVDNMPPKLELKPLPEHLKYAYLGPAETLPVMVAADLTPTKKDKLLRVFRKYQDALGWTIADIKGISPAV
ncbi:PREDICTED: LOW QUALITY PROTEIN, partial [Prunus dulcis]